MTGAGYPHRSEVSGGRRWLSLFLLAVFMPMLWPAESWASLTRPAPPAPAYPFAVAAPDAAATVPTTTVVLRVTLTTTAAGDLAAVVAEEPLCTRAAAAVLTAAGTGRTPIRAPARESRNAYRGFSNFQNAQILEVSQSVAKKCFITGDDILGQSSGGQTVWLLYDGHGSTRALAGTDTNGQATITARYSFDAYGMMLGGDPTLSKPAATDLLYSGEQFDPGLQQQYLRARYYDQKAGVFASLDPFGGSSSDPQSLHKYVYCQGDSVNGVDPTGTARVALINTGGFMSGTMGEEMKATLLLIHWDWIELDSMAFLNLPIALALNGIILIGHGDGENAAEMSFRVIGQFFQSRHQIMRLAVVLSCFGQDYLINLWNAYSLSFASDALLIGYAGYGSHGSVRRQAIREAMLSWARNPRFTMEWYGNPLAHSIGTLAITLAWRQIVQPLIDWF